MCVCVRDMLKIVLVSSYCALNGFDPSRFLLVFRPRCCCALLAEHFIPGEYVRAHCLHWLMAVFTFNSVCFSIIYSRNKSLPYFLTMPVRASSALLPAGARFTAGRSHSRSPLVALLGIEKLPHPTAYTSSAEWRWPYNMSINLLCINVWLFCACFNAARSIVSE